MASPKASRKIRILELTPTMLVGGAENVVKNICKNIDRDKFEISLTSFYCGKEGQWPENLHHTCLRKTKPGFKFGLISELKTILRQTNPDIIHNHAHYHLLYLIPANLFSTRSVIVQTIHNNLDHYWSQLLWKIIFRVFKIKTVNLSASLNPRLQTDKNNTNIPNGIPIEISSSYNVRCKKGKKFLFMGRLEEQKDPLLALQIFNEIVKQDPSYSMTMIGTGSLTGRVNSLIAELDLEEHLHFINKKVDPTKFYKQNDFLLLTSRWEGMPLTVIEAMSEGMVVFAKPVGGVPDIIKNSQNGFLLRAQFPKDLAAQILREMNDNLQSISQNARDSASTLTDKEMTKKYEKLFVRLLSNK